jgi:hypothetical protein
MTSAVVISVVSLALSVISTAIATITFWRTRRIQNYEYATRLQLEDEEILGAGPGPDDAFSYSVTLVNHGVKPVDIDSVFIDYGGEKEGSYLKHHVDGKSHLPPNGKRPVRFVLSKAQQRSVLDKFGLEQCLYRLRVCYISPDGTTVQARRNLMALGPHSTTIYAQRGDALG